MIWSDTSIPFVISSADLPWGGAAMNDWTIWMELPVHGLMRLTREGLLFQFRRSSYGSMLQWGGGRLELQWEEGRMERSEIEEVVVPRAQVQTIGFKRARWFKSKLTLQTNDLHALAEIPGSYGNRLTLRIPRDQADAAERLVSRLQLALSEQVLRQLGESDDEEHSL